MANRRMFSKTIVESARFIKMPVSSQALYFHLGVLADDEGVVEAYPAMKLIGSSEDDLRVLVSKGFVTILNEDLVSLIMDWNVNNQIRKDRFTQSEYHNLLVALGKPNGNQMATIGEPSIGKDSIDKLSIDKDNKGRSAKRFTPPTLEEVTAYCNERKNNVDPQKWMDYYTSNGWKVGKNPMKDWKAAVRTWERNNYSSPKKVQSVPDYMTEHMDEKPKEEEEWW